MSDELLQAAPRPARSRRRLTGRVLEILGRRMVKDRLQGQLRLTLPDGHRLALGQRTAHGVDADLTINSYRVLEKCIRRGSVGFGEAYMAGDIDCSDLVALFRFFLVNRGAFHAAGGNLFKVRLGDKLAHKQRRNTLSGSRRNIAAHYDMGNDFYAHWLDAGLTYSSALFDGRDIDLETAQRAKYARALELADVADGQSILEIGCGWGGMAEHAAQAGKTVDGITLSARQLEFAKDRMKQQDLDDKVSLALRDYRQVEGRYDAIVSIEMIEAVGEENWPAYFATLARLLKPGGQAVIQAITIAPEHFERYRAKVDFIQRYVFPGGMLLTDSAISAHATDHGMALTQTQKFGRDYATTLRMWRQNFNAAWDDISPLGYDEKFRRMWLYYLTYCEAGFDDGAIDVGFYVLRKQAH
ncbi:class I SAM-dependent methyltransferase [Anderseniella sp. Alg231-50]|uniref:class I SAM-dependent methyltransferase n=1 Tax=Anderseniella sp. Alg231-50 TaxID=1922226 RepID=UPI000D550887